MSDYLEVEYSQEKRPLTSYPAKLANHLYEEFSLKPGMKILEFGCGRAELLKQFKVLGLETFAADDAPTSRKYAEEAGAQFSLFSFKDSNSGNPFKNKKYDVIISKSFVEHLVNPIDFALLSNELLTPGGLFISLTPDWESNKEIFFDDLTHVKPFTRTSMQQLLEYGSFEVIKNTRFRQLPITWRSRGMNALAAVTSLIVRPRAKNKWMRWSKELMIIGVGKKPLA
jgi:2-polyprenyl-3-methyl-5-hydroxy-6-metoxy-1,4-benzoquinol methylase